MTISDFTLAMARHPGLEAGVFLGEASRAAWGVRKQDVEAEGGDRRLHRQPAQRRLLEPAGPHLLRREGAHRAGAEVASGDTRWRPPRARCGAWTARCRAWLSLWLPSALVLGRRRARPPRAAHPLRVSAGRPSPRPGGRPALLLPRRHRVVALPPADPRGGRPLPPQPRGEGLHRGPGRRPLGERRPAHAERLRRAAARRERPAPAERGVLRPRRLGRRPRGRAGPHRRPAPHLGRQVAQPAERARPEGLPRRRHRPRLRALHRPALRRRAR